jgi:hypothetical protein
MSTPLTTEFETWASDKHPLLTVQKAKEMRGGIVRIVVIGPRIEEKIDSAIEKWWEEKGYKVESSHENITESGDKHCWDFTKEFLSQSKLEPLIDMVDNTLRRQKSEPEDSIIPKQRKIVINTAPITVNEESHSIKSNFHPFAYFFMGVMFILLCYLLLLGIQAGSNGFVQIYEWVKTKLPAITSFSPINK